MPRAPTCFSPLRWCTRPPAPLWPSTTTPTSARLGSPRSSCTGPTPESPSTSRATRPSVASGPRAPTALGAGASAKGFGFGGLPRERAYHDALLDLGAPAMGLPPVVRIAAPAGDGAVAYRRRRTALRERFAA